MGRSAVRSVEPGRELALGLGFLSIPVAVVAARASPATGYEASLYTDTPALTWALLLGTLLVALWVILRQRSDFLTTVATVLGGTAMMTIVSLPVIRGFHYLGRADALSHLGLTKDIGADVIDPQALFYPGYHSISVAVSRATGLSTAQSLLVAMLVLFGAFLVFVPLTVKLVTGDTRAMGFAAVFSWFVLPINNIATHLAPHTNSLALFYLPAVLFFLVLYVRSSSRPQRLLAVTPTGVALGLTGFGLLLLHVQHAVNVLVLFVAISLVQFIFRRWYPRGAVASHRPLYAQTALFGSLVGVWFAIHETPVRAVMLTIRGAVGGNIGGAATVTQRSGSLAAAGGGLGEIFLKMFLVSAFVGVVTLGYLVGTSRGLIRTRRNERAVAVYSLLAFVPLGVLFALYFLGTPTLSFRQIGFIYVLCTILGAMAVAHASGWLGATVPFGRSALGTVLALCLVLSLLTAFASPYIYSSSPAVAEQEIRGYEGTLDTRADDVPLATLSSQPYRYGDAYYGATDSETRSYVGSGEGLLRPFQLTTADPVSAYSEQPFYAAISEADRTTEIDVYNEINYRADGVETLDTHPQSDRVLTNGEFELYLVADADGN